MVARGVTQVENLYVGRSLLVTRLELINNVSTAGSSCFGLSASANYDALRLVNLVRACRIARMVLDGPTEQSTNNCINPLNIVPIVKVYPLRLLWLACQGKL